MHVTITGANPCFVPYPVIDDPASRPADADVADFVNDRGDTVKSLLRLEKGTIKPRHLPGPQLLRSRPAVGCLGRRRAGTAK